MRFVVSVSIYVRWKTFTVFLARIASPEPTVPGVVLLIAFCSIRDEDAPIAAL